MIEEEEAVAGLADKSPGHGGAGGRGIERRTVAAVFGRERGSFFLMIYFFAAWKLLFVLHGNC